MRSVAVHVVCGLKRVYSSISPPISAKWILFCPLEWRKCPGKRPLRELSSSLPLAAVEDLELIAGIGGEEGGYVAEALGEGWGGE
jgi:hypothetical protein